MKQTLITSLMLSLLIACSQPPEEAPNTQSTETQTLIQRGTWCDGAMGGASHSRTLAAGLGRAHVGHRLFGATADWLAADLSLVDLLNTNPVIDKALMAAYAEKFTTVCALDSTTGSNAETRVDSKDGRVVIVPGTTLPVLPEGTTEVVIDLRNAVVDTLLTEIIGLAIKERVTIGQRTYHIFHGFPSQDDGWTHYETENVSETLSLQGTADFDIPLTFWTGPKLSPNAALWAGGLRLSGRAALVGYDVFSYVAESTWTGHDGGGFLWRSSALTHNGADWPDVINADVETADHEQDDLGTGLTENLGDAMGASTRGPLADYERDLGEPDGTLNQGTMKAALLVAYGTLDWFYPFFDLVGREIDQALETGLNEIDNLPSDNDRKGMKQILGRFMHTIHDGHGFYSDWASNDWSDGYLDIQVQEVDGLPVVRTSAEPDIEAGDTITAVDGVAIDEWYQEATSRYSAASDWYRFVLATDELKEVYNTKELTLKNEAGAERTVTTAGTSWIDASSVAWGGTLRASGWLTDLGEDNIYYVNMAGAVTPDITATINTFDSYLNADGIILDMRDYPNLDIYEFARNFNPTGFTAPIFGHPTWSGADDFAIVNEVWSFDAGVHVYTGPVALMVSAKSVSAAECFAQMLVPLENVTVVGQTSAATNGTITNAWLPGKYQITFTGMRLVNPDGTEFHGIGVVPDHVVTPTPAQFAAGEDPELQKAIDVLSD